jgi:alkaline phosphatase D
MMINEVQMTALLAWLADGSGKVKFVVSSVPVFPDATTDFADMWSGFPAQRARLLEHIRTNKIRKVVFVSGDVHCSFTSELRCAEDPDFLVNSIVSSSFFWPYPHTETGDFHFGQTLSGMPGGTYLARATSPVYSTDNFARLDVAADQLAVSFFERKGARLGKVIKLRL